MTKTHWVTEWPIWLKITKKVLEKCWFKKNLTGVIADNMGMVAQLAGVLTYKLEDF